MCSTVEVSANSLGTLCEHPENCIGHGALTTSHCVRVHRQLGGRYIAAVALVTNIAFMISAAWLLVVSLYSAGTANSKTVG